MTLECLEKIKGAADKNGTCDFILIARCEQTLDAKPQWLYYYVAYDISRWYRRYIFINIPSYYFHMRVCFRTRLSYHTLFSERHLKTFKDFLP